MKNPFDKYICKHCNSFETYSIIKMARHIKKEHNEKLTKKDWKFAIKYHIITQILKIIFRFPIVLLAFLLCLLTYSFWWLNEQLENLFF